MLLNLFTFIVIMIAAGQLFAQDAAAYFVGSINQKLAIQMDLQKQGDQVYGDYYYESVGQEISLKGTITPDFELVLTEYDDQEQPTATFEGQLSADGRNYSGLWYNAARSKSFKFSLRRVAYYHFVESESDSNIAYAAFPAFEEQQPALKVLNQQLADSAFALSSHFLQQISEQEKLDNYSPAHPMERSITYDIAYYDPPLISMTMNLWEYTGGAHGNYSFAPATIVLENGEPQWLQLKDIFTAGSDYQSLIDRLGMAQLRQQQGTWAYEGMNTAPDLAEMATFTLLRKGLQLTFAPYQVGPYAAGAFKVLIPYQELLPYLSEKDFLQKLQSNR